MTKRAGLKVQFLFDAKTGIVSVIKFIISKIRRVAMPELQPTSNGQEW